MTIKPETVKRIRKNAEAAKGIYEELCRDKRLAPDFNMYFHLRPTSSGITIVSTLSDAPMRGMTNVKKGELEKILSALNDEIRSGDTGKVANVLHEKYEVKKRKTKNAISEKSEEEVQADFIKLLSRQSGYEGIKFVASELMLNEKKRFDVVGIEGKTLYVFELKKGKDHNVMKQIAGYIEQIDNKENKKDFSDILSVYPNNAVNFSEIKGVVVTKRDGNETKKENNVELWLWYYEPELRIEKG
jgi:hypothetical protein